MIDNSINLVIGGEAGQGLVTLGQILAKALVREGYSIVVTQSYQSRIRAGHNTYTIRVSHEEIRAPKERIEVLVALDEETVLLHEKELSPEGIIIVDEASKISGGSRLQVPLRKLGSGKFYNVAALGVIGGLLGIGQECIGRTLDDFFGQHDKTLIDNNRIALAKGFGWMSAHPEAVRKLPPVRISRPHLAMDGNEAIALGAMSAGLKFFAFYPMTPATSIAVNLAVCAERMGLIVEQAEDEIAAINMAIGASFAGAPSMVATSGGGFALMTEAVSLAGMTETPVVIVVSQRPGPSTGLPTRTEQGDLEFVLHAGHGEFPRAIFAPGTVEDCFHLTRKAFEIAEDSHGPVFLLTDQFLADSYRSVDPFKLEELSQVNTCTASVIPEGIYKTYAITDSGVSPRLFPGISSGCVQARRSEQLVVADSDEHSEDGHLTEDLAVRKIMVEKRLRKLEVIRKQVVPPELTGDDQADLMLVCWGSTKGAVLEAASRLPAQGANVATLHLSQVWPLVPELLLKPLEAACRVVCVESNATGQLARLIHRETGFSIESRVLRYDGLPITPEFILRELEVS
ncbi:MAG: 2-oxoacid:acceptor oxidoreductase subunit alpha [Deltaproteobacteria bacterium]|nr:2-oxoacid:acceptor oxidoreductase subunit alpha [Deltaproteobacteria bacterium]